MISISCPNCDAKLKVKGDLAGKKVRCPTCKQAVAVQSMPLAFESGLPPQGSFANDATVAPRGPSNFDQPDPTTEPPVPSSENDVERVEAKTGYLISSEIARGGMGAIMRAVDGDIQREVAVKFLLNQADAKQKARFVEEAQITGQLEHPNIVPIHQLGVHDDGRCFFSMKMVKGRSLAEILNQQSDPQSSSSGDDYTLGKLLNIFVSICNAMAYAHSRDVVHRDLKPANIMVGDFGEVYVMDWGLSKVLGKPEPPVSETCIQRKKSPGDITLPVKPSNSKSGDRVSTNRSSVGELTQAGAIMGTPAYMPPEQAQGEEVDTRADVYSLGAILYEIMTLTPPVGRSGDMMAVLMRVFEGQIDSPDKRSPARAKAGWVPPELAAIALKALARHRDQRYQTVDSLKRDIDLYLEGRSVSAKHDSFREMAWKLLGMLLGFQGFHLSELAKPAEAETCFNQSIAIFEKLRIDSPDRSANALELGRHYFLLGILKLKQSEAAEGARCFDRATAILEPEARGNDGAASKAKILLQLVGKARAQATQK